MPLTVVLCQPQIPQNTGNIVRTCACSGARLILVKPLGFSTSDRMLRRAGLDYWEGVNVEIAEDLPSLLAQIHSPFYLFTSKSQTPYTDVPFPSDAYLIFGSETAGLPPSLLASHPEKTCTLPMVAGSRCLNLASSVAIGLYEAWRQNGFGS